MRRETIGVARIVGCTHARRVISRFSILEGIGYWKGSNPIARKSLVLSSGNKLHFFMYNPCNCRCQAHKLRKCVWYSSPGDAPAPLCTPSAYACGRTSKRKCQSLPRADGLWCGAARGVVGGV